MQKLRKYLFLSAAILSATLVIGQTQKAPKDKLFVNEQHVSINGEITNYTPTENNRFITFSTFNLHGQSKDTAIYISKYGAFKAKLFQPFEGDFSVEYADRYFNFYYIPGTTLNIKIDASKWSDPVNMATSIFFSGEAGEESKLIAHFTTVFNRNKFMAVNWSDTSKSDEEISLERIARMNEEKDFLNSYIAKNNIRNVKFKNWAENYITYKAGFEIAFENFTTLRKKSLTIDQLMKVLKEVKVNNPTALYNSSYYAFLYNLQGAFQIIVNINPLYKDSVKLNGLNPVPVYAHYIDQHSNGIARQLMYFDLYRTTPKSAYDDLFDNVILNIGLKEQYKLLKHNKNKPFNPFSVIERLRSAAIDTNVKSRLINIFETRLDKFLFIDFWGPWCGPCMKEMPLYPQLIRKFDKEKIKFLFIAVYSEESKIQKVKDSLKIDAEFIMLNDNEAKAINNILQFNSYPSHFIISPKGVVIDNSIRRISAGENLNQIVVDKIDSLLEK